jgi:hypothetical protein
MIFNSLGSDGELFIVIEKKITKIRLDNKLLFLKYLIIPL